MLQAVRHAHIVQFYGVGTLTDGAPFIVTELMELGALWGLLKTHELDWGTKTRFAHEIALGMACVHGMGRMHRDMKSGNVLVTEVGGVMRVKVGDFGTATLLDRKTSRIVLMPVWVEAAVVDRSRTRTMHTKGLGTMFWMAPEVGRPQYAY